MVESYGEVSDPLAAGQAQTADIADSQVTGPKLGDGDVVAVLTLTSAGTIRTAASGQRVEITASGIDRISFYPGSGAAGEAAGFVYTDSVSTTPYLRLRGPATTALPTYSQIWLQPSATGTSGIFGITGHVIPSTSGGFDLGASTAKWQSLYLATGIYDGPTLRWDIDGDLDLADGADISGAASLYRTGGTIQVYYSAYSSVLWGTTGVSIRTWETGAWADRVNVGQGANVALKDVDATNRLVCVNNGAVNLYDASGNIVLQIDPTAPTIKADLGNTGHTLAEISPYGTLMASGTYSWTAGGDTLAGSGTMTVPTNGSYDVTLEYAAQPVIVDITVSMRVSGLTANEWWGIRPFIEGAGQGNSAIADTTTAITYYYLSQRWVGDITPVGTLLTLACAGCAQTTAATVDQVQIAYCVYRA